MPAAGDPIHATDVDDLEDAVAVTAVVVTATVGTVSTGFTVNDVRAATALDGKLVNIDLYCNRSGADITATSGNISDTSMFTLNSDYYPSHVVSCIWSNGAQSGEAVIGTTGVTTLRTGSATIPSGSNIRLSATYLVG